MLRLTVGAAPHHWRLRIEGLSHLTICNRLGSECWAHKEGCCVRKRTGPTLGKGPGGMSHRTAAGYWAQAIGKGRWQRANRAEAGGQCHVSMLQHRPIRDCECYATARAQCCHSVIPPPPLLPPLNAAIRYGPSTTHACTAYKKYNNKIRERCCCEVVVTGW